MKDIRKSMWDSTTCRFNIGVCCDNQSLEACARCGWNPAEAELRRCKEEIKRKMEEINNEKTNK